jgi:integrase/recombinase XerD
MTIKKTEGLAPRTIEEYIIHFGYIKEFLGEDKTNTNITVEDFQEYVGYMLHEKELAAMTVSIKIRTMRALIRYCHKKGFITEPIHEDFKPIKTPEDTLESFNPDEIKRVLSVIDEDLYTGFRDKVMVFVLLDTLVRISELVAMKRSNVDFKAGVIKLEAVGTKTRKAREVPISTKTAKLLKEYMKETEDFYDDYLFPSYDGHQINQATIRLNLTEYGKKAGIRNKRVSPHTFRHTGALFYIMNSGDPFSLQKILGHSDMSMTHKYIQMTDTDVRKQHNAFSPILIAFCSFTSLLLDNLK